MSFHCFITFVDKLLGPVLLLVFRSKILSFTSSTVVRVIKKVKLFGFFNKLENCFIVGEIIFFCFCNFLPIVVNKFLKCSEIYF